jgi:hypothetical protein
MRCLHNAFLAAIAVTTMPAMARGQQTDVDPRVRCTQLLAYWDQRAASKGEGGSSSDMTRKAAGLDCDNRRYGDGIRRMEDLLRQQRYPIPPPQ